MASHIAWIYQFADIVERALKRLQNKIGIPDPPGLVKVTNRQCSTPKDGGPMFRPKDPRADWYPNLEVFTVLGDDDPGYEG